MVPRGIALGQTVGEIYTEGISKVGILYVADEDDEPQWWWDLAENVCLYGDPDLRVWVPSTEFSDENHWQASEVGSVANTGDLGFYVDGHMPFGPDEYPHAREPITLVMQILWFIIIVAVLGIIILGAIFVFRKRKTA